MSHLASSIISLEVKSFLPILEKRGDKNLGMITSIVTKSDTRNWIFQYPELSAKLLKKILVSSSFAIFYANSKWSAPKPKCTTCFKNPILNGFFQNPERGFRIPDPSLASSAVHEFEKKKSILEKKNIRLENKRTDHHQIQISNLWKKQCFGNLELHWLQ